MPLCLLVTCRHHLLSKIAPTSPLLLKEAVDVRVADSMGDTEERPRGSVEAPCAVTQK